MTTALADATTVRLADGLGSLPGVTDDAGDLVGSADCNVFGEVRGSSGVSALVRFTGELLV